MPYLGVYVYYFRYHFASICLFQSICFSEIKLPHPCSSNICMWKCNNRQVSSLKWAKNCLSSLKADQYSGNHWYITAFVSNPILLLKQY